MGSPVMNDLLTSAKVYINKVIAIPYITLYFFYSKRHDYEGI